MRLLSQRLESAESHLDRRLEIFKQRKAEVGFIKAILSSSGRMSPTRPSLASSHHATPVSPLPPKAAKLQSTLTDLHHILSPLDIPVPANIAVATGNTKAWEMGRKAYLHWAVGKMVPGSATGAEMETGAFGYGEKMDGLEEQMNAMGGGAGMEKLVRAMET